MKLRLLVWFFKAVPLISLGVILASPGPALAAEKLRLGVTFKGAPNYEIIGWVAKEQNFWRKEGLDMEYFPFRGGTETQRAVAGAAIDMGVADSFSVIQAAARGVPSVIVCEYPPRMTFYVWVRGDSAMKKAADLKGTKIGITRRGGAAHAFAVYAVQSARFTEKDVKMVAVGGLREQIAGIRSGGVDAITVALSPVAGLVVKGELRGLMNLSDYLPKPWIDMVIFARADFGAIKPDLVKRGIRSVLQSVRYVQQNHSWLVGKLMAELGFSQKAAELVAEEISSGPGAEPRLDPKALENVVNFLIQYGLVAADEVPPLDKLYNVGFLG